MRFRHQPAAGALGFVAALAMGAVAFPRPATARPPIGDSAAARAEGTRLFRAKNFEAAWPKFEKAAQLAPADPEPLADLALCRQRLGDTGSAEKVNRQVIDLGSTGKGPHRSAIRPQPASRLFQPPPDSRQLRYFPEVGSDICGGADPGGGLLEEAVLLRRLVDRRRELDDAKPHARQHRGLCRGGALRRGRHRLLHARAHRARLRRAHPAVSADPRSGGGRRERDLPRVLFRRGQ